MTRQERVIELIADVFAEKVSIARTYVDELHLEIAKEEILGLAVQLRDWGFPLVQLTATDERASHGHFRLFYTFANDLEKFLIVVSVCVTEAEPSFPSIMKEVPAAHWYEREIRDLFGLDPLGHLDKRNLVVHADWPEGLYPLRKGFSLDSEVPRADGQFPFDTVEGEGVIQVPVGPIHAGIIEPGHFRFSAVGDTVLNLEARFFYTHRGMEKLAEGKTPLEALPIVERICGACSFSHTTSYCQALEKLSGTEIPTRANYIRTVVLELERLYNHVGDVGNICAGIGFAFGTMHGARLREELMQLNEIVFGSRFLRGINTPGGVRRDISSQSTHLILVTLEKLVREFRDLVEIMFDTNSYMDRVQNTGIVWNRTARDMHAVGPAARSAGVDRDVRRDHPYAAYNSVSFKVPVYQEGDVLARVKVRIDETFEAVNIIRQILMAMPAGELTQPLGKMIPYSYAVGMTESARGENVHFIMMGQDQTIDRYMVRSASYVNWPVLPMIVPGNIIPDFPLINKSFELCYSCMDR